MLAILYNQRAKRTFPSVSSARHYRFVTLRYGFSLLADAKSKATVTWSALRFYEKSRSA